MPFIVVVKARLVKPFAHWVRCFDDEEGARTAAGVVTIFRAPVIGEQAVVFAMRTSAPRLVHDLMYHPDVRPGIEQSGLVVGSEHITVCDTED